MALFFGEVVIQSVSIDGKTSVFKHLGVVTTELADMVILSETTFAFFRVSD